MANNYEVPSWAGKPPPGLHLDISKEDQAGGTQKFIQKFMIDEKKCYLFGRNPELNDFRIDHASGSRVHAALITCHKHLNLTFLVDLGSTHGTFLGSVRLESHKPTVVHSGSSFHFGASTRNYTLRERPKNSNISIVEALIPSDEALPDNQEDVDNLTEYNTAHNRKISTLGISTEFPTKKNKRKRVHFNEDEIIINPEDIDDSIGKFRNLVHSTVVVGSTKRMRMEGSSNSFSFPSAPQLEQKQIMHHPIISAPSFAPNLYAGLPSSSSSAHESADLNEPYGVYSSSLLPALPNPAPEIEATIKPIPRNLSNTEKVFNHEALEFDLSEPTKKKYAKEAWPKKAPKNHLGDI